MAKRFIKSLANQDLVARHHSFSGSFTVNEQENLLTDAVKSQNGTDIYGEARRWLNIWDSLYSNLKRLLFVVLCRLISDFVSKVVRFKLPQMYAQILF